MPDPQAISRSEPAVRAAVDDDVPKIIDLIRQLGYDVTADFVRARMKAIAQSVLDRLLVAERDGMVVGVMAVHVMKLVHKPRNMARITALVIDATARGTGCGGALLRAAEAFARQTNCSRIEVTSGSERQEAHRFYENHGYPRADARFLRELST